MLLLLSVIENHDMLKTTVKKYRIKVLTGLHIGAGKDSFEIGGMDNPVVKDLDGIPYVPGSSLKGKIRFLLECKYRDNQEKKAMIQDLFGSSAEIGGRPTILLIRDGYVDEETKKLIEEKLQIGEAITEEKYEVSLRRMPPSPRPIERVPKNYVFMVEVVFRFFDNKTIEKRDEYMKLFEEGVELLNKDYLGGSGSRGYGKVHMEKIEEATND